MVGQRVAENVTASAWLSRYLIRRPVTDSYQPLQGSTDQLQRSSVSRSKVLTHPLSHTIHGQLLCRGYVPLRGCNRAIEGGGQQACTTRTHLTPAYHDNDAGSPNARSDGDSICDVDRSSRTGTLPT